MLQNFDMESQQLHRTQMSILHALRYAESERFNRLMQPTGHTSDTFKFHLRKLVKLGYVEKQENGSYQLTVGGKEYANVLDEQKRLPKKQPKLAVMLLVTRQHNNETEYLLYKRKVNPFYGFWTAMTDAVLWGETFEAAALKRLKKHAGYEADFRINSMVRIRNAIAGASQPAEDILFAVMEASNLRGEPHANYAGGVPAWLTLSELRKQQHYFPSLHTIIENACNERETLEIDATYGSEAF
jgi:ADP-ribose pyrophosphatase YjhB (NUDIX family)